MFQNATKIAPRGAKINARFKEVGYKVFVTKLAAKMLRSGFQELPKMFPRRFQDAPKVLVVVVVVVIVIMMMVMMMLLMMMIMMLLLMMMMEKTNCLGSTRRYHFI